nr:class I SAM-dependent methyltransferase [uncultured Devosia sp.]
MSNSSVGPDLDSGYLLSRQYRDSKKLEARANLHSRYGRGGGGNWFEWIAGHANLPTGAAVLDIGCGPGWLWAQGKDVFPSGLALTLADFSPGMVADAVKAAEAAGRYAKVEGVVADASKLPFADASFDAVLACHMLYHVPDARVALGEFKRVLRPGGILAVTTNLEGNMGPFYTLGASAFGGKASDPAADVFGLRKAEQLVAEQFGDVQVFEVPGELAVTSTEDIVLALTSFPPGDDADDAAVARLVELVEAALEAGGGTIVMPKVTGMVRATKAA